MPDTAVPRDRNEHADVPLALRLIATGLFSGYSPIAPGTAGSLLGLALYMIPGVEHPLSLTIITACTFFVGTIASAQMEKRFGDDPQVVVIDEVVGMWVTLLFLPKTLVGASVGFLFFRFYDIVKPPPARSLERLKNGWGIMLDDVAAGIYANITLRLIAWIFPKMI